MSVTYYLLLSLILLSLLVVDSRRLGSADQKEHLKRSATSSIKVGEKMRSQESHRNVTRKEKPLPKEKGMNAADSTGKSSPFDVKTEEIYTTEGTKSTVIGSKTKASTGNAQDGSLVIVSWRVPRQKTSEKHPGFNLDYSPPKTHPPSHN
ncbi:uncharacterized protein LOC116209083 [Punica granatum]|uniref:Uncharacterized protein n=2 Tax=Punica granatum TaxID=22663 RepID=A0A2I0KTZ6_PUNGR|nr:uncharacterized protein LOC116209083 [Punica granatum]PKI71813.1 hypothetical protein CRG98_007829 [Punica granatum]